MAVFVRKSGLTAEQTTALIESVKSFACIWNPDHEEKVHRGKIARAWLKIAQQMNLPEDLIRVKWKNLRDVFIKEVKKYNLNSVDDYQGKWKHFRSLWFLYRNDSGERAASEDESSESPDVFESTHEPYVKIEATETEVGGFMFLDTDENNDIPEKREREEKSENGDRTDIVDIFASKRRRLNQVYSEEEYDMMFLLSLAPYLKLLKPVRKLIVRNKIQATILEELERDSGCNGSLAD